MRAHRLALVLAVLAPGVAALPQCELAKLNASDGVDGDEFGRSVGISGETMVVGSAFDDDAGTRSGSAYVFERMGVDWIEAAKLTASDASADDRFGSAVSASKSTVIVGARQHSDLGLWSGAAYVFDRIGGVWVETAKLLASDGQPFARFGHAVALQGDLAVVGAMGGPGAVYVFRRQDGVWSEVAKLNASDSEPQGMFGQAVSTDGTTIAVGAPEMGLGGAAYAFELQSDVWTEVAKLIPGVPITQADKFGSAIDVSGDTIVVGAEFDDVGAPSTGSAFVFERGRAGWSFVTKLVPDPVAHGFFGKSVAAEHDVLAVGATGDDDLGVASGAVYLYQSVSGNWTLLAKFGASDTTAGDIFGRVALSGATLAVGAQRASTTGSAYVFGLSLCGDVSEISVASGGTQVLDLDAGPGHAGELHLLLGSTSGTSPGFELAGFSAPLNPDGYFHFTLASPNTPPLTGSLGFLDASGQATAAFTLPAGLPPALAGLTVHHAFGALDPTTGSLEHVSNASAVLLVP